MAIAEMRPVTQELLDSNYPFHVVSISDADKQKGSPKVGDMIARNPENHDDKWLVEKEFYEENYEPVAEQDNAEELNIGQMRCPECGAIKSTSIHEKCVCEMDFSEFRPPNHESIELAQNIISVVLKSPKKSREDSVSVTVEIAKMIDELRGLENAGAVEMDVDYPDAMKKDLDGLSLHDWIRTLHEVASLLERDAVALYRDRDLHEMHGAMDKAKSFRVVANYLSGDQAGGG